METRDRNVLLIGGGGYVGTAIGRSLYLMGYKVRILDNFIYGHRRLAEQSGLEIVQGDMNKESDIISNLEGITDVVILGGLVGNDVIKKNPDLAKYTNYDGISTTIESLKNRGLSNVIFISTCSNYGITDTNVYATEETQLNPLGEYAKAKVIGENLLLSKCNKVDYIGTVLRFATAFGVSYRTRMDLLINEFVYKSVHGEQINVYDENTWRPYCHVNDFGNLIDKVLTAPKEDVYFEVFNGGGNQNNYTKKDIINVIKEFGYEPNIVYDNVNGDPRDYRVSFEKSKNILGFEVSKSLSSGISDIINYSKVNKLDMVLTNNVIIKND